MYNKYINIFDLGRNQSTRLSVYFPANQIWANKSNYDQFRKEKYRKYCKVWVLW